MTEGIDVEQWPDIPDRNDNCLCGSGKKYKKCCQAQLEAEVLEYETAASESPNHKCTVQDVH